MPPHYLASHASVPALTVPPLNNAVLVLMAIITMPIPAHAYKHALSAGLKLEPIVHNVNFHVRIVQAQLALVLIVCLLTLSTNKPVCYSAQMAPFNNLQRCSVYNVRIPVRFARIQQMSVCHACLAISCYHPLV